MAQLMLIPNRASSPSGLRFSVVGPSIVPPVPIKIIKDLTFPGIAEILSILVNSKLHFSQRKQIAKLKDGDESFTRDEA